MATPYRARSVLYGGLVTLVAIYRADAELLALLGDKPNVYSYVPQGLIPPYVQVSPATELPFDSMGKAFGSNATFVVRPTTDDAGYGVLGGLTSRIREITHGERWPVDGFTCLAVVSVDQVVEPIATEIGGRNYWQQPIVVRFQMFNR